MATLGKYELHEILGKGGFGTVYRATDLTLERVVAIKVLHPQLTVDPDFIERFSREARLMAKTEHPNIVGIYEVGEAQGRFFIVMRYLPGGSLAARLQRGPLALEDIQGILSQVCAGLQELHRQGFVHRDLKPANILFDANNQAVVTDFGLARAVQMSSSSSGGGTAGTPFYRAPELWRGKPPASPATDVYSLGCILGEMLIGKPLFGGDTPDEVLTRHLIDGPDFGEPWPPEGVPHVLAEVVAKALQRDPAQRYPDAQTFAQALTGSRRAEEDARRKAEKAAEQAHAAAEERAQQAAEELAQQQAADSEKARLAADEDARREAEAARQALQEREKARLEAETLAGQNAEGKDRRERETQQPMETVLTTQSTTSEPPPVGTRKKIPIWGWLLGVPVLLTLLFFAVRGIVLPASTTAEPTQAPVIEPTAAPTAAPTLPAAAPTVVPTAAPTAAPTVGASLPPACTEIGQTWVSPVDGMTLVCVPAGKFTMGSNDGSDHDKPEHEVYLDAFWIDQTEVTNDQFTQFVSSTGYQTDAEKIGFGYVAADGGWRPVNGAYWAHPTGPQSNLDGKENHPVVQVNWKDASAYCAWAGRELPSEAQWEKAARGTDGRKYPWGDNAPTCSLANFNSGTECIGETTRVGSYPTGASPYGALDTAGNVLEWVADWYGLYTSVGGANPTGPVSGEDRVVRGGGWNHIEGAITSILRRDYSPNDMYFNLGFRCATSLP